MNNPLAKHFLIVSVLLPHDDLPILTFSQISINCFLICVTNFMLLIWMKFSLHHSYVKQCHSHRNCTEASIISIKFYSLHSLWQLYKLCRCSTTSKNLLHS